MHLRDLVKYVKLTFGWCPGQFVSLQKCETLSKFLKLVLPCRFYTNFLYSNMTLHVADREKVSTLHCQKHLKFDYTESLTPLRLTLQCQRKKLNGIYISVNSLSFDIMLQSVNQCPRMGRQMKSSEIFYIKRPSLEIYHLHILSSLFVFIMFKDILAQCACQPLAHCLFLSVYFTNLFLPVQATYSSVL